MENGYEVMGVDFQKKSHSVQKRNWSRRICAFLMTGIWLCFLTACGGGGETNTGVSTNEVAGDYYIDLTDLGMKLTIYLQLDEEGAFLFSNTLDFEVNKSSGTFQKSGDEYIMVYDSVNGEEKSVSDGLTSSFVVTEEGNLDFSGCEKIYYGSAGADSSSADNPDAKLIAKPVTGDFEAPDTSSAFKAGSYTTEEVTENGITYSHVITFYEDNTYLHMIRYEQDGKLMFDSETGTYGVSTTQLALEPTGSDTDGMEGRVECEVVDASNLKLSLYAYAGAKERTMMDFGQAKSISMLGLFRGTGTVTGSDETFDTTVMLYEDGSYESTVSGFTEKGILVIDSEDGVMKQYPDHPDTAVRGLAQVETVPSGVVSYDGETLVLEEMRIRVSDALTRYKCTVK